MSRAKISLAEPISLQAVCVGTTESHANIMVRLGHEHMVVDSKEFFRPGRLPGRLPPCDVVLAPSLVDSKDSKTHGAGSVSFPHNMSLTCPLPII